jgi:hypothetical protein
MLPIAAEDQPNARDVAAAVERARRIVSTWFVANPSAVGRLLTMLSEITSNVTHSHDRGLAVIQRYRTNDSGRSGSRVTVAVGDLGIGIKASLLTKDPSSWRQKGTRLETGSDYILQALRLGVTSRDELGGMGLAQVLDLVVAWAGTLTIRSGRSRVSMSKAGATVADDLADIPGVQVTISIQGLHDDPR